MKDVTKLNLRLPALVRDEATILAAAQGLSLNAYLLRAVSNANQYWGPKLAKQQRERLRTVETLAAAVGPSLKAAPGQPADSLPQAVPSRVVPKVGQNQPCPCGSGEKYKRCHGRPSAA